MWLIDKKNESRTSRDTVLLKGQCDPLFSPKLSSDSRITCIWASLSIEIMIVKDCIKYYRECGGSVGLGLWVNQRAMQQLRVQSRLPSQSPEGRQEL
jgi:hypothetical protein